MCITGVVYLKVSHCEIASLLLIYITYLRKPKSTLPSIRLWLANVNLMLLMNFKFKADTKKKPHT